MEKDFVCLCNNCGTRLIDKNPQTGATPKELTGSELKMEFSKNEDGDFWACPVCKTDEYLKDL